jgi:hypothetical protein
MIVPFTQVNLVVSRVFAPLFFVSMLEGCWVEVVLLLAPMEARQIHKLLERLIWVLPTKASPKAVPVGSS